MTLFDGLKRIVADLTRHSVSFALIGGLAVSVRTQPRFTRDVDLSVSLIRDPEAEALTHALIQAGYEVLGQIEHDATARLAAVRLSPPGEPKGPVIDLMFASSGIEAEIVSNAERLEIQPGLNVGVARLEHLIALKVLSRDDDKRPQDRADLVALLSEADSNQLERAREALRLITSRNNHRGKDLLREFESLLA